MMRQGASSFLLRLWPQHVDVQHEWTDSRVSPLKKKLTGHQSKMLCLQSQRSTTLYRFHMNRCKRTNITSISPVYLKSHVTFALLVTLNVLSRKIGHTDSTEETRSKGRNLRNARKVCVNEQSRGAPQQQRWRGVWSLASDVADQKRERATA